MKQLNESHDAPHLIERQMLLSRVRERASFIPSEAVGDSCRFITIARTMGSLGDEVAAELAARLQWQVFDREIVDAIAKNSHVRRDLVRNLDEHTQGLIHDTVSRLLSMAEGISFGNTEYRESLLKTLAFLASRGGAIIVGRGSACALQGDPGLHLRFVASPQVRIRRIMQQQRLSMEEARHLIEKVDAERRDFVQHHFGQSVDDLRFYDASFNTDRMSTEMIVQAVYELVKATRQASKSEPEGGLRSASPSIVSAPHASPGR